MKRKKIRKLMKNKKLTSTTKQAQKAEEERRKRIAERQKEVTIFVISCYLVGRMSDLFLSRL